MAPAVSHTRSEKVLSSWKEIAAYLQTPVRTVQRWEHHKGLPVRRPNGRASGVVVALPSELDRWSMAQGGLPALRKGIQLGYELLDRHCQLLAKLFIEHDKLTTRCQSLIQLSQSQNGIVNSP